MKSVKTKAMALAICAVLLVTMSGIGMASATDILPESDQGVIVEIHK